MRSFSRDGGWPWLLSWLAPVAVVTMIGGLRPQSDCCERRALLETPIRWFEFHGNRAERGHMVALPNGSLTAAVHALALHGEVRIALESLPDDVPPAPIGDLVMRDTTVGEILQELVRRDPAYEYVERLGVIEVRPVGSDEDPGSCLNLVIPEHRISYPWRAAFFSVKCQIKLLNREPPELVADPIGSRKCHGEVPTECELHELLDFEFEHQTVRDTLSILSARAGNVAWYASFSGSTRDCESLKLGFIKPRACYAASEDLGYMATGMPARCTACHYHRK